MTKERRDYMFLSPITHCNSDSYRQKVSLKGTRAVCTMLKKPYTYNTMKRAVIAQKSQSNDSQKTIYAIDLTITKIVTSQSHRPSKKLLSHCAQSAYTMH